MKAKILTSIAVFCLSVVLLSCTKEKETDADTEDLTDPANSELFLSKVIRKDKFGSILDSTLYYYDSEGRIERIIEGGIEYKFLYNNNGTFNRYLIISMDGVYISETFHYDNTMKIKYVENRRMSDSSDPDTTFLIYDNTGRIQGSIRKVYAGLTNSIEYEITTQFQLDDKDRIVFAYSKENDYNNPLGGSFDTTYYKYDPNGNLISRDYYSAGYSSTYYSKETYEYDSKLNYWPTMHLPKEYVFFRMLNPYPDYSLNNLKLRTLEQPGGYYIMIIYEIIEYIDLGYPKIIKAKESGWSREFLYSESYLTNQD